ncbi:MAG: hypothetical protein NTV30_11025, partial [Chloroflexi bacterium]|nr:hypothetical protein [Chloroflexota bacterium]
KMGILALEEVSEGIARPVIIEVKNDEADTGTLALMLRDANWSFVNSELLKKYADEAKTKYKDVDISTIKLVLVAPRIKEELLEVSNYVDKNIAFGFLEVKRFKDNSGELLILDWVAPSVPAGLVAVTRPEWDWQKYDTELRITSDKIEIAKNLYDNLCRLNNEKAWGLTPVFRKSYIVFKKAGNNVIQIELWTKPCLVIRLLQKPTELGLPQIHKEIEQGYDDKFYQYWFRITNPALDINEFVAYIEKAI